MAFEVTATIERPAAEVWDALTRWSDAPTWMAGIDRMEAHGDTAVGTRLSFYARGKERGSEIVRCEPGRALTLRSVQGGVTADYTYTLDDAGDGRTRMVLVARCQTSGLLWGLVGPLIRFGMRMADKGQLDALKQHLESG